MSAWERTLTLSRSQHSLSRQYRLKSFVDEVNRARLPAFELRTRHELKEEMSKVEILKQDLDSAYRALPPHIAQRHKALQNVTKNMQSTMAGAMETRDGHLSEKLAILREAQMGAHRFLDGSEEASSEAGLAYLVGIFDKEQAAAITIQKAFRSYLSKRGPVSDQALPKFKAKARYWEPIEHRPLREAKLSKEEMLKKSRVALLHAEDAVVKLEKQASESALSMVSRMRVPREGASVQYRLDDRDYKILLLGRDFVEKQEADELQYKEDMAEMKRLEAERMRLEELLERERANPLMEKIRKTMKDMSSGLPSYDSASLKEERDSLVEKMMFGNGLALISAAIKEHALTGDIREVIQQFVRELKALASSGKRIDRAALRRLASGWLSGGSKQDVDGGEASVDGGGHRPSSSGYEPLTEEDFMDVLRMCIVAGSARDPSFYLQGISRDKDPASAPSASFASRTSRFPLSWLPHDGITTGPLSSQASTDLSHDPLSPSAVSPKSRQLRVNSSFLSRTQRQLPGHGGLPWQASGDIDGTLLEYDEPGSPVGSEGHDKTFKPSAAFSSQVDRFTTPRSSTSGPDSSQVILPLDEYSLKLLSMSMAAAEAQLNGHKAQADELWAKTEKLVASVMVAPSAAPVAVSKPVPLAFGSAAPRFNSKLSPSAPKVKPNPHIRSKLANASTAVVVGESSEGSLVPSPPPPPPPLAGQSSSPNLSSSARLSSPRVRNGLRPNPLQVKARANILASQASEPIMSHGSQCIDGEESFSPRPSAESMEEASPSRLGSSPNPHTPNPHTPNLGLSPLGISSQPFQPLGISSLHYLSPDRSSLAGSHPSTSHPNSSTSQDPSMVAWAYQGDSQQGPVFWPQPSVDATRGTISADSPSSTSHPNSSTSQDPSMVAWAYQGDSQQGPVFWPQPSVDATRGTISADSPSLNRRNSEAGALPAVQGKGNRISASSGGGLLGSFKQSQSSIVAHNLQRGSDIMNRLAGSVGGPTFDLSSPQGIAPRRRISSSTGGAPLSPSPRVSSSGGPVRPKVGEKPSIISQMLAQDKIQRFARLSEGNASPLASHGR